MKRFVYQLIREDASHLGGPMGSEYTTHISTTPYTTIEEAYNEALCINRSFNDCAFPSLNEVKMKIKTEGAWSMDCRCEILTIKKKTMKPADKIWEI